MGHPVALFGLPLEATKLSEHLGLSNRSQLISATTPVTIRSVYRVAIFRGNLGGAYIGRLQFSDVSNGKGDEGSWAGDI